MCIFCLFFFVLLAFFVVVVGCFVCMTMSSCFDFHTIMVLIMLISFQMMTLVMLLFEPYGHETWCADLLYLITQPNTTKWASITKFMNGFCSLFYFGVHIWNNFPPDVRHFYSPFRNKLKTYFSSLSIPTE